IQGDHYQSFEQNRYTGNDTYGIALSVSRNCCVTDTKVFECSAVNGYVHGIVVQSYAQNNSLIRCISNGHYALGEGDSVVNPTSKVYGFIVRNQAEANTLHECASSSLVAPRESYGFWIGNAVDTSCIQCTSVNHKAISGLSFELPKYAIGFQSDESSCTTFEGCCAQGMNIAGEEEQEDETSSLAIGFVMNGNYDSVTHSKGVCNNGGAGIGAGIELRNVEHAYIDENCIATNHGGRGYGIWDSGETKSSLVIRNKAYGNSTENYHVAYEGSGQSLPLTAALYGDVHNLHMTNAWNNISFELPPGYHYPSTPSSTSILIRQQFINN
ncbi:MAG: hypothetical protein WBQ73_02410, partial [Candidatus Babeliales bacterium]